MLPLDARIAQILSLTLFLLLGVATRDWTLKFEIVGTAVLTCIVTQIALTAATWHFEKQEAASISLSISSAEDLPQERSLSLLLNKLRHSLPSACITALGLSLLLRVDHGTTMLLASAAAIASKFLLRVNGKHIFNPANFGIIVALLLSQDAWVSPGQWGEEGWYALLFLSAGGLVLKFVGRWDTTVAFLASYAALEAARNLWLGWTWDVWLHRLMSGSLLLFAFFMVTDPRTIPNARFGRLIWAAMIAGLTFVLRNVFFLPTAVMWALFALAPLSILIDWLLPAERFCWAKRFDDWQWLHLQKYLQEHLQKYYARIQKTELS